MHYKLYRYELSTNEGPDGKPINPDKHFPLFDSSKGTDGYGNYTEYRGKRDTVLMHVRNYGYDFIGLVGKHSTEREVTLYDENEDKIEKETVVDDDYPNAAFMCFPRIKMIACIDSSKVKADAAMTRLHRIIAYRQKLYFSVQAITQTFDLRKAVRQFRLIEVTFDILPVNPHTDDIGKKLDESRKLDHIKKIVGTAHAGASDPMKLDGGFLTAVQQLQQSGHAKVGFKGLTDDRIEVKVEKPSRPLKLSPEDEEFVSGENVGVKINIREKQQYPFEKKEVMKVRAIAKNFSSLDNDNDE